MNKHAFAVGTLLLFSAFSPALASPKVVQKIGSGNVSLVKYKGGAWQMLVEGKPYIVKGMSYSPDPVGISPVLSNEWMAHDFNKNGKSDGPYDAWVDKNGDNYQDFDENTVGDFQLLKDMGCNTIRLYHPDNINKEILRDLYKTYGIRVIMGHFLGAYTVSSGAEWSTGTDYSNEEQKKKMMASVRQMVMEHKDEPYVLMWMLGNENDAEGSADNSTLNNTNACVMPRVYAAFLNDVSKMIKSLDHNHPVGVCNATSRLIADYRKYAPEIDIVGMNAYTGPYGFGTLWNRIKKSIDRPVLITEYGTNCYNQKKGIVDEDFQATYHRRAWKDIEENSYEGGKTGIALGGVVFCWLDKWWLCGSSKNHDVDAGSWKCSTIDGMSHDEWMGICGQGNGTRSPFLRYLRKAYYVYKDELWNSPFPHDIPPK